MTQEYNSIFTAVLIMLTYGIMTIASLWTLIATYIEYKNSTDKRRPLGGRITFRYCFTNRFLGSTIVTFWGLATIAIGLMCATYLITEAIVK